MHSIARSLVIASSLMTLAFVATPALALCKYGSPHCINPHPGPSLPKLNTTRLPDQPPGNEDCTYYGSCYDGSPDGTGPDGVPNGGLGNGGSPALTSGHLGQFHPSAGVFGRN